MGKMERELQTHSTKTNTHTHNDKHAHTNTCADTDEPTVNQPHTHTVTVTVTVTYTHKQSQTHLTQSTGQVKMFPEVVEQLRALLYCQVAQLSLQVLRLCPVGEIEEAEQVVLFAHTFLQICQRLVADGQVASGRVVEIQQEDASISPVSIQENLYTERRWHAL